LPDKIVGAALALLLPARHRKLAGTVEKLPHRRAGLPCAPRGN
jgi:hypothetical protein